LIAAQGKARAAPEEQGHRPVQRDVRAVDEVQLVPVERELMGREVLDEVAAVVDHTSEYFQ